MNTTVNNNENISITGILIQDPIDNGYTAYFAEFPEVVAEGDSEMEAKQNLHNALKIMFELRKQESTMVHPNLEGRVSSFNLQIA